jgi:hypothetical protein
MVTLSMQTNTNVSCDVNDDESCDHNNEDRFEEEQEDILTKTMLETYYFPNKYMIILKML